MNAPFALTQPAVTSDAPLPEIWEPFHVQTDYVDGAAIVRVLPDGQGHLILWRHHLGVEGGMERVVAARLVMPREVMREVALAMLNASMLDHERVAEMRQKMD